MLRLQLIMLPCYLASITRFPYLKIVRIIGEAEIALSGTLPYSPSKIHCYLSIADHEHRSITCKVVTRLTSERICNSHSTQPVNPL